MIQASSLSGSIYLVALSKSGQRGDLVRFAVTFTIPSVATEIGCWPVRAASRMRLVVQQSGSFIFNGLLYTSQGSHLAELLEHD